MYNNLKKLREQRGLNMKEMAGELNIPYTTYVGYEKGEREPSSDVLIKIANYYNTSVDYILGVTTTQDVFSIPNIIPIPKTKEVPLLGTIACGEPILAEENIENYVKVDSKANVDFALKCKGDSMINARIFDGDIVYIHSQPDVENGEIAIEPQFESVWSFTEGLAAVQINGLWGYIDTTGTVVIEPKYKLTWGFSEGLAAIQSTELYNLYGYINTKGETVIEPQFNYAKNFKNGAALVQGGEQVSTGHKFAFVKPDGTILGNFEWFGAEEFSEGLAEVYMTYESAFTDIDGNIVIDYIFNDAKAFSEGFAAYQDGLLWGYIDKNTVIEPQYTDAEAFSEGIAVIKNEYLYGFINKNGEALTEVKYKYAYSAKNGRARVGIMKMLSTTFGYIDTEGNEIIEPQYIQAKDFSEGYAAVQKQNREKWNLIDINGNDVSDSVFDEISYFENGYAVYKINGKYGFIKVK